MDSSGPDTEGGERPNTDKGLSGPPDTGADQPKLDHALPADVRPIDAQPDLDLAEAGPFDLGPKTCGSLKHLGSYAIWCGKVNVHLQGNKWIGDSDCKSGCQSSQVTYCKKFYPTTKTVIEIPPTPVLKPFNTENCTAVYMAQGARQFMCCGM